MMLFLLGVLLGMLSGAIAVATFKENDDERYTEGYDAGRASITNDKQLMELHIEEHLRHELRWENDE